MECGGRDGQARDASRTAASAAADMHRVTGALESLRAVLSSPDPALTVWDRPDNRVGDAFERPEAPALVGLRATYVESLGLAAIAEVRDAYARSASEGWEAFLTAFADGAVAWRFELCEELVQSTVATPGNEKDRKLLAIWTRHATNERWYEAYPMFRLLADQAFLPSAYVARFVSVQGLIELYHLLQARSCSAAHRARSGAGAERAGCNLRAGRVLLHGDDVPGARGKFERAQEIDPLYASAPLLLGDCCLRENDLASAAAWYRQTADKFPGNFSAATRLCRLAGKQTDLAKIEETIHLLHRRCEFIEPHTVYSFELEAGAACQEAKHVERAHEWFERAIARDPARIGGYTSEGYLFLEQGKWDDARRYFLKVIEVAPEALDGYWGLARVDEQAGEWQQVQKWYDAALPCRPEWEGMIRASIAYALNRLGKTEEAEASALQAIRSDPSDEPTLERVERVADDLARTHHDPAAAVRLYDGFLDVLGSSYEARYRNQIGVLKANAGDHSAAAAAFAEAVKADPEKIAYRISLARELRLLRAWEMGASLWTSASARVQADASFRTEMALLRNAEANEAYRPPPVPAGGVALRRGGGADAIRRGPSFESRHRAGTGSEQP